MTIQLPNELETRLKAVVHSGQFASVDEAIAEAARLLLKAIEQHPLDHVSTPSSESKLGFIGALRDDADLLDKAVEHAMRVREERPWRLTSVE